MYFKKRFLNILKCRLKKPVHSDRTAMYSVKNFCNKLRMEFLKYLKKNIGLKAIPPPTILHSLMNLRPPTLNHGVEIPRISSGLVSWFNILNNEI